MLLNAYRSWVHSVKRVCRGRVTKGRVILNTAHPAIYVGELQPPACCLIYSTHRPTNYIAFPVSPTSQTPGMYLGALEYCKDASTSFERRINDRDHA